MNVLITGAGGFIGSYLVESQLEQGYSVRAVDLHVDRLGHIANHPNLEIIPGDICNLGLVTEIVSGMDVIYHLASAHLDVNLSDDYYRKVNVEATSGLTEAAQRAGVKRFVHCSSVGVFGDIEHPPANESTHCNPTNIYERTKLEGERAVLDYAEKTGLPVVVARPAWVYGPRCPRTEKIFRAIAKGRFIIFGDGKNLRHPVYVSDAVRGMELCAQADHICGEVFILAGSEPVPTEELIRQISQGLGVKQPTIHLPILFGKWIGLVLEKLFKWVRRSPPFSSRSVDFFLKDNAYDIRKARRVLGYKPQIDLHTGILNIIRSQTASLVPFRK